VNEKKVLVLIPARFNSSRFPGKPLAKLLGKSMIQRVYENCQEANYYISPSSLEGHSLAPLKLKFDTYVVTDSDEIQNHLIEINGKVCRVDDAVKTGSERIYLAFKRFFENKEYDLVVNMQGDEPLLTGNELRKLCSFHLQNGSDLATLVRKRDTIDQDFNSKNVVKVIYSEQSGICHYFSRSQIPYFVDDKSSSEWYQHIGIYSYKIEALERFSKSPPGFYENRESLEQLRALELGMKILGLKTEAKLIGVDAPEDIQKVERVLTNG
jgi:3-deoxy-manno-octulosonate cytidylyltransferase (CMP-KDO synthetase)